MVEAEAVLVRCSVFVIDNTHLLRGLDIRWLADDLEVEVAAAQLPAPSDFPLILESSLYSNAHEAAVEVETSWSGNGPEEELRQRCWRTRRLVDKRMHDRNYLAACLSPAANHNPSFSVGTGNGLSGPSDDSLLATLERGQTMRGIRNVEDGAVATSIAF